MRGIDKDVSMLKHASVVKNVLPKTCVKKVALTGQVIEAHVHTDNHAVYLCSKSYVVLSAQKIDASEHIFMQPVGLTYLNFSRDKIGVIC